MPGRDTKYEQLARQAAERLAADQDMQRQLSLLPDERGSGELVEQGDGKRGKGKALNQMREFLASKGYRMPEEVLAEIAGLTSGLDAVGNAMVQADRVMAWAQDGAVSVKGAPAVPTMAARLRAFEHILTAQLRAADAMLPYGVPKVTPDVSVQQNVQVLMPAAPTQAPIEGRASNVTPIGRRRMVPADVAHEMQRNQRVNATDADDADDEARTE